MTTRSADRVDDDDMRIIRMCECEDAYYTSTRCFTDERQRTMSSISCRDKATP
jgi:hypothetical protein